MRAVLDFLWPGPLVSPTLPSTFLLYLLGCILVFSRSLQWRSFRDAVWRWLFFAVVLVSSLFLNGPIIFEYVDDRLAYTSTPLIVQLVLLILSIHLVTYSPFLTVLATVAIGYSFEHILADVVLLIPRLIYFDYPYGYGGIPWHQVRIFGAYCVGAAIAWWSVARKVEINNDVLKDRKWWLGAIFCVFVFVIFTNNIGYLVVFNTKALHSGYAFTSSLVALLHGYNLICSLMVLSVLLLVSSRNQIIHEVEIMKEMNRRQQRHYEMSQEYRDVINMKMHDMKKFLAGDDSALMHASPRMMASLQETLHSYDALFNTGSTAVDAILNDKSLYCAQRDITLNCLVDGSALNFMEDADIYSLVGNIMDNAIEAVEKINSVGLSTTISLNIERQGSMVIIRQTNQFVGSGELVTSKPGKFEHGFGLKSIRYVVNEYKGRMTVSTKDNIFSLAILLPQE